MDEGLRFDCVLLMVKGYDLTVYCPWLPFVWMCEVWRMFCVCLTFVWCLSVCNANERSSFSFTVWDGRNEYENENELVKFVLVLVQPYGTALHAYIHIDLYVRTPVSPVQNCITHRLK